MGNRSHANFLSMCFLLMLVQSNVNWDGKFATHNYKVQGYIDSLG